MEVNEFEDAFRKGLGRAYIYVKKHGDTAPEIKKLLERGCIEDFAYDRQCEGCRSDWVYKLIQQTSNPQHYEEYVLNYFKKDTDDSWNPENAFGILKSFAMDGSEQARIVLYEFYAHQLGYKWNESWIGGYHIIELDGIKGFLFAAKQVGHKLIVVEDFWEDEALLVEVMEKFKEDEVLGELQSIAENCKYTQKYIDSALPEYKKYKLRQNEKILGKPKPRSLEDQRKKFQFTKDEIIAKIEDPEQFDNYPSVYMRFGVLATDDEVEEIIDKMSNEQGEDQLMRYAWVFRRRYKKATETMPERLLQKMLELIESDSVDLVEAVSYSLSSINDERIRRIGIKWLQRHPDNNFYSPFEILEKSARQEDTKLISAYFEKLPREMDEDQCHSVILDLINFIDNIKMNHHLERVLERCYDWTPCSICRDGVYQHLLSMGEVSLKQSIKEEHEHDSYERD